mgnify:FL=1|tara:strand:- start:336 stop:1232 length:897 start_codon:yes stop_codon:yes gene_type:complete
MNGSNKALVTGASGFIGKALVKELLSKGYDVVAVGRSKSDFNLCDFHALDISEPGVLDSLVTDSTTVYHLAASADVANSVSHPVENFKNTFLGSFNILETAKKTGCRVIFPSTASIYSADCSLPVTERSRLKPSSPYGAAKASVEMYCFAYRHCYGVDVRIARLFSVYGPGMSRFAIHDIIRKIQNNKKELLLLGDGTQIRDYLYIDDLIEGLLTISQKGLPGEDYNLASGIETSILSLATEISVLMEVPEIKIVFSGESFPGDIPKWFGDVSKLNGLGFKPKISLPVGLGRTIEWLN